MSETAVYNRYWRVKTKLPERFGQRCRILRSDLARKKLCIVQFEDGQKIVTSRFFIRKVKEAKP
jgi:hypothetical protein